MTVLRASGDGHLEDGWEKRILCSNSRHSKKDSTGDSGKGSKTIAQRGRADSGVGCGDGSDGSDFDSKLDHHGPTA